MDRSENMRRIKSRDTKPEMAVRRLVFQMGYRYRLRHPIAGKPDLVFIGRRKAIFVHGCFWHQHPGCIDSHIPHSNKGYWTKKLEGNQQRDKRVRQALLEQGWDCLVVWECETKDLGLLENKLRTFLDK